MADYIPWFEQLRDPRWQKLRLEVMQDAGFRCVECGHGDKTLNVHHLRYVKGRKAWDYPKTELRCLCEDCHREWHELRDAIDAEIAAMDVVDFQMSLAYMVGNRVFSPPYDLNTPLPAFLSRMDGADFGLADAMKTTFTAVSRAFAKYGTSTTLQNIIDERQIEKTEAL